MSFRPIKAVIFDMDGLLLDTEGVYTKVTQQIVSRFGKNFEWSLKQRMMGQKAIDTARLLVQELQLPITPEQYLEEREPMQNALFAECEAMPGAIRLVEHLSAKKIPIAIATGSHTTAFELKTKKHKSWVDLFNVIIRSDNPAVKRGKPAPDIFLEAARCLGIAPEDCLVFEDAPLGVAAGLAANMSVVWIPDPNVDKSLCQSHLTLNSLTEFDPSLWSLPAFE
eukprot:TRINITY_DN6160_c1_g1_i1.p1 TRINITY_DN6160_c1_g1~~TRINITY_DN6160_c1_g1_i1.p1  ORF type:complete len:244 (-),score=123.05 TRINITY_DN6160_c1_g1_i1:76-747(-)